jgi:hypothetical protein
MCTPSAVFAYRISGTFKLPSFNGLPAAATLLASSRVHAIVPTLSLREGASDADEPQVLAGTSVPERSRRVGAMGRGLIRFLSASFEVERTWSSGRAGVGKATPLTILSA